MAIAITSFVLAQNKHFTKLPASLCTQNSTKSEWVGNTGLAGASSVDAGYDYAIRFTGGELTQGNTITKVQFYSDPQDVYSQGFTNGSYQIRIFEGGTFNEVAGFDLYTVCGTQVYFQDYTATLSGAQEVELTTPYTIGTEEFWVVIHCNGESLLALGAEDNSTLNQYVSSMEYSGTDYWTNNSFCTNPPDCTESTVNPFGLAVYVDDGGAYVENSDLMTFFIDNEEDQNPITELALGATDDLDVIPVIYNLGPDNADQIINIEFTVDGTSVGDEDFDPTTQTATGYIASPGGITYPATLLTSGQMDTQGLTIFDVCINITYAGVDNVSSNDEACITVTRATSSINSENAINIEVYPNPAINSINVLNAENETIEIVNMIGEIVISVESTSANQTIDVENLSKGTYFVKINSKMFKINIIE